MRYDVYVCVCVCVCVSLGAKGLIFSGRRYVEEIVNIV